MYPIWLVTWQQVMRSIVHHDLKGPKMIPLAESCGRRQWFHEPWNQAHAPWRGRTLAHALRSRFSRRPKSTSVGATASNRETSIGSMCVIDYLSEARGWGVTCANELDVGRTHMGCTRATFSWTTDNTNLCHLRSPQVTSDSMGSELKGIGLRLEIATPVARLCIFVREQGMGTGSEDRSSSYFCQSERWISRRISLSFSSLKKTFSWSGRLSLSRTQDMGWALDTSDGASRNHYAKRNPMMQ